MTASRGVQRAACGARSAKPAEADTHPAQVRRWRERQSRAAARRMYAV